ARGAIHRIGVGALTGRRIANPGDVAGIHGRADDGRAALARPVLAGIVDRACIAIAAHRAVVQHDRAGRGAVAGAARAHVALARDARAGAPAVPVATLAERARVA